MLGLWMKNALRILGVIGLLLTLSVVLPTTVGAQESRVLTPDVPVSGTLNENTLAQVFTFEGVPGQTVNLMATAGPGVALLLTDASGQTLAQAKSDDNGALTLSTEPLVQAGTYYVTLFVVSDAFVAEQGTFALVLTTEAGGEETITATPSVSTQPGSIVTTSGMEITLTWDTTADMNLQVRDPIGGTLYWDSRMTSDGGSFGFDANGLCEILTESPVETATWPGGALPTGSYEILVYYRSTCEDEGPVVFNLDITVDGVAQDSISGTLLPPTTGQEQVFITRFNLEADGSVVMGPQGVYYDVLATAVGNLPPATPLERDVPIQSAITNAQPYQVYTFAGTANELISIQVNATSGSLDTLLFLLGPNGNVLYSNDDRAFDTTDSALSNVRLAVNGNYTVIVTRYGQDIGGTEGNFDVLLSGPSGDIPPEVAALNLPEGDIEITLLWNTNADLQLLVRDPALDSVFDDTPSIPSGGRLAAAGNVNCTPTDAESVSYIYWPTGFLRAGTYEVDVWYQNECNDTRPVDFTLIVSVDNEVVFLDTVRPLPGDQYVSSFNVDVNRQVTVYGGGVMNLSSIDYQTELPAATALLNEQPVLGSLSLSNPFDVYVFEGTAGDVININMNQVSGNLDTLLFVLDPANNLLDSNDDAVVGEVTNSLISDLALGQDGRYIVLATRFGILYGATNGAYELTVSRRN